MLLNSTSVAFVLSRWPSLLLHWEGREHQDQWLPQLLSSLPPNLSFHSPPSSQTHLMPSPPPWNLRPLTGPILFFSVSIATNSPFPLLPKKHSQCSLPWKNLSSTSRCQPPRMHCPPLSPPVIRPYPTALNTSFLSACAFSFGCSHLFSWFHILLINQSFQRSVSSPEVSSEFQTISECVRYERHWINKSKPKLIDSNLNPPPENACLLST